MFTFFLKGRRDKIGDSQINPLGVVFHMDYEFKGNLRIWGDVFCHLVVLEATHMMLGPGRDKNR